MIRRFDNTKASARALVEEILNTGQERFVPRIQDEVVKQGKKLVDTDAGAFINETLLALGRKHQEEKEILRDEMKRAQRQREKTVSSLYGFLVVLMLTQTTEQCTKLSGLSATVSNRPLQRKRKAIEPSI